MANNSPTIVAASLSDDQLKTSINNLVAHVDEAMKKMVQSTNNAVGEMEAKLKSLGNLKIDSGGTNDGGASKRTKAQNAETDAVEKNVAARDKQIKKNQEAAMSFDNFAKAQQVAIRSASPSGIRNADTLQTMNIQLDLLRERLREARQQYSSFVALAAHATTTGDKGLFQYATDGVHRYEQEVRNLIPQIRTLQSGIQQMGDVIAPQGHTIQNYVNSLQKASPELAQLNEQFKRGQSLLQQGKTAVNSVSSAFENGTNISKKSLDELNAYVAQSIQRERERRGAIRQTGLAARETADQLIRSAHQQASIGSNAPITGARELRDAIEQMRRAYFDMSSAEKMSPIGIALNEDIKRANDAMAVIQRYNQSLFNSQQNGANKISNASTLNSLRESLKNLTEQYSKLTIAEIRAGKGDELIQKYQKISRAAHVLQKQLSTPISFSAIDKFNARSLDDIAYKMQMLRSYRQSIDLTKPNAANEIKQVDEALAKLQKDADKWMSKSNDMIKNNTALGRSWNYMKNRLAFYFTVGASTQFIKNLIEVRSQYEMNERALGILINSAERGTQIFNELSQMALVSPYTLIELSTAAKQLTAYDVAAKDVVDTTRRLADMAAAVGIPIERLTYALGQIKAYGYLNSRDARMFANAGIPLVKQLSDYYTELEGRLVSTADVYDRIKKKAIDYNEVMEVINKMTDQGGKFFDFQAKMADTLKVRLANLTLAWNNMLNDMGKESQGVLTWGIGALRDLFLQWKQLDNLIKNAALAVGVRTLLVALRAATIGLGSFGKAMTWNAILGKKLGGVVVGLAKSFGTLFSSRLTWFALLAIAAVEATQALFGVNEAQKALNESIRNGAKDNYDNISKFLEQYQEVRDSLYAANAKGVHRVFADNLGKTVTADKDNYLVSETEIKDIDNNEAKKAWEAVREQIELTVASSDKYIGNLLSISNMSERVRQGFNLLDDVQVVNAALKELDDDTIKVSKDLSAWWNAWQAPDGLIGNLKDYQETLNDIIAEYGTLESFRENTFLGGKGSDDINDYETALERFRDDLQKTTDSIINFIELKGWSGDESKINQVFEQITQKLVLDNQLDPQKAFTLQIEVEEARSKAAKEALLQRINDEKAAYKISHDESVREALNADIERYNNWNETNGRSKVEWERFTKWLKEQHISETTAMFRNMDAEDIKSLNFQEGKHAEWVTRMVTQYAKEHKMSYDEAFKYLKSWVRSANQWSVFIPLTISTENKKSVYDQLGEYDKAVDEADAQIERLTKRIGELNAKKQKSKEETQELANAEQELADAQKAKADAEAKGGHGKKEKKDERAANKAAKQAESELQKALKDELSTIDKVRSIYKDLTKEGMSHADAVERATRGWDETVNAISKVLQKNGLQKLDLSKFAGIENPRELVNMLQSQLNTLLKRGAKPAEIKELQTKIQTLNVDAEKYDLTKITKGLNNELGKLKDEYELAVELDANPEMGNLFADWMGIDTNELPRTFQEVVRKAQQGIDKVFAENNRTDKIDIASMLNKESFDKWVKDSGLAIDSELVKAVEQFRQYLHKTQVDENKKMTDEWSKLVEKYGDLQAKILKIYKDSLQEQIGIVRKFGDSGEVQEALDLSKKINLSQDPAEIARLQEQLANIIKSVVARNPQALDISTAVENKGKSETAKATWEDFKNSELYTMTFEDMANNSTRAIELIMEKLENLKNKVKEDPASMKALIKSLEDAEKELNTRDPFGGVARSLRDMSAASQETKAAQEALWRAEVDVEQAQQEVDNAEDGTPEEQAAAQQKLADAVQRRAAAQVKLTQAENKGKKAQENLKSSLQGISNQLGNVQELFGVVSKLFRAGGDDETADAIDAINEGFTVMTQVIMGVMAAMVILESSNPWLLAIAAALSVIVGLVSFLIGNDDKKIVEQIEESERAVKRLELAYIDLDHAVQQAYGMATIGANMAAKANKELQLVELKRQLALERSRDSKHRDEDKIIDLQKQIKELEYDIADTVDNIVNDLLGISSVGDAMENMMDAFIEALRSGEDAMATFDENVDEMIANMVKKMYVTKILQPWFEEQWNKIQEQINQRAGDIPEKIAKMQSKTSIAKSADTTDNNSLVEALRALGMSDDQIHLLNWYNEFGQLDHSGANARLKAAYEKMLKEAEQKEAELQKELTTATMPTTDDIRQYAELLRSGQPIMEENMQEVANFLRELGLMKDDANKNLSALQQGIQGITEETAGALEAYMNSVSQQVYLHSDLLTQIRDIMVGWDFDVQLGALSQILLQLQSSYQVQMSIQNILVGWSNPSGGAVKVELIS